jgi:hypothetical protein
MVFKSIDKVTMKKHPYNGTLVPGGTKLLIGGNRGLTGKGVF